MNDILDEAEVAALLACEPSTVQAMAREGELPAVKFGKHWRFPRAALLEVVNRRALENKGEEPPNTKAENKAPHGRSRANISYHAAKRRAAKKMRTVPWANSDAIKQIYESAEKMTRETGIVHHVGHIIPMQGALVSGLHVESNLQVLVGSENIRKKNRFEVA